MGPITAGLGVASLAGQIFGAIKGGQANRANQDLLNKQREDNEKFYNMNVNRDFLETNAAKGMFEQLRKQFRDRNKEAATRRITTMPLTPLPRMPQGTSRDRKQYTGDRRTPSTTARWILTHRRRKMLQMYFQTQVS